MFYSLTLSYLIVGAIAQQSLGSDASSSLSSSSSSSSTNTDFTSLSNGPCPKIVVNKVDFDKHYGEWYEVERSANNYMGSDKCHKLMWGKPVNNVSEVINKSILKSSNIHLSITSHAPLNDEGYIFTYHFPTLGDVSMQYYALDFVPDDYTIIWSCEPRGNKHIEKA
ncbi:uncharacterized protein LOC141537621 isoform X2 [Cotesia typhae]|uniref:uncharacterized protein LOC141537621 isoform X2 n=1 Tax=Cotesia typhae TaxID=2053667 RepID=UPI003D68E84D